ncbi:MAG: pantoate--beta-alanine ligase [Planctomycetaceae bacterium]|jgi:pantoate--beta-alanine ligase|nr:pantoate--beta-alanine ligase [Planctomycetaceae bacterium]
MLTSTADLRSFVVSQHKLGKKVGFVPTMGALHEGHLSLVEASAKQCDATVVSIFVNPSQFGPNEDFQRYPRTLENDLSLLQKTGYLQAGYMTGGEQDTAVEVFVPSITEMYPAGFDTSIHVGSVSQILEGKSRPLHFQGVATVVLKLFLASQADTAFFGQKDFQQICIVRKMVSDLNVPIEIVMCPIVREPDGLAMSSRNRYLSASERRQAVVLSQSLRLAEMMIVQDNIRDAAAVKRAAEQKIRTAPDAVIEYVSVADSVTLDELQRIESKPVILLAVKFGTTRLIDNLVLSL